MRKFLLAIFLSVLFFHLNAQAQRKPGNEWINYSKTYYKIKVGQNGIYRVKYSDLQTAGLSLSGLDPTHFQLFFRGAEVPISTSGGASATDFFEFYGQKNDGTLDTLLFNNPGDDINRSYSMYTDTAIYFLTVGDNPSNIRYAVSSKSYGNNPQPNFLNEQAVYVHNTFQGGNPIDPSLNFVGAEYIAGAGWMGSNATSLQKYLIAVPNLPTDTLNLPKPEVEILVYGKSDVDGVSPDHHLVVTTGANGKIIWDTVYDGFQTIHKTIKRYWSDIIGKTSDTLGFLPAGVKQTNGSYSSDAIAISFIKIRYTSSYTINPANPVLGFNFKNSSASGQTDFNFPLSTSVTSGTLVLYDLTHNIKTNAFAMSGSNASVAIDNFQANTSYFLYDPTKFLVTPAIKSVSFTKPNISQNANYIIISNKLFSDGANKFAAYKSTQKIDSANNFNPMVAYADDLYDQFYYGIHHPVAIQNFMAYLYNNQSQKPQYLFLLGKGMGNDIARSLFTTDYVPSIGFPASDELYTAGIDVGFNNAGANLDPKIAIGRLQAITNTEILVYLEKLKEYDASLAKPHAYLKTSINVDGGDFNQIPVIQANMDKYAKMLSGPRTGLTVNSYYSVTNVPVNGSLTSRIQYNIEHGTSLMAFMAHGSAEQLGVNISDTTTLKNKGLYPIMYLNGCQVGNTGGDPKNASNGRFYTIAPEKGAIIWLSHSIVTLDNILYTQMQQFFQNVTQDNYGKSVGSTWRKTIADLSKTSSSSEVRALCVCWELQGDPSVMFPYRNTPDFAVYDSTLAVGPANVVASSPNFTVSVPVFNVGIKDTSKIKMRMVQTFPDQSTKTHDTIIPALNFQDTIVFNIIRGNSIVQGLNKFDVYINSDSSVKELSFANNHASFQYFFNGNSVRTMFPSEYDIVNVDTPLIVAQSRNMATQGTGVYFEMDTTDRFNSPLKQRSGLLTGSSLLQWKPKLNNRDKSGNAIDSTVYYWHARINLPLDTGGQWESKSFVYIKNGSPGWSQSHWQQYKNIVPNNIVVDTVQRSFRYYPTYSYFLVEISSSGKSNLGIKADNGLFENFGAGAVSVIYIEYDSATLKPIAFNRLNGRPLRIYNYNGKPVVNVNYNQYNLLDPVYQDSFAMAINAIPHGNYVLLMSYPTEDNWIQMFSKFKPTVFQAFRQIGDTLIGKIHDSVAYVMAGQKEPVHGNIIQEAFKNTQFNKQGLPFNDTATIHVGLPLIVSDSGSIVSEKIGPATNWKTAFQVYRHLESPTVDQNFMSVHGIDNTGKDTVLYKMIPASSFGISSINAAKYPNLELESFLFDTVHKTPPQLRLWQVEYDGLPEGTLVNDSTFSFQSAVHPGDSASVIIKYQNVGTLPMTKVLVVTALNNLPTKQDSTFYPALNPGEFFMIKKKYSTKNLTGTNFINVSVNPNYQQPEQTLENNFVQLKFLIINDHTSPLMDVTFDGMHIADGQVVSPSPEILVSVKDENLDLLLNDTSDYKIFLVNPGTFIPNRVYMSNPKIQFTPGNNLTNNAIIKYNPGPLADGEYFFTANASDIAGNTAGPAPYNIHFKVVNNPSISYLYLYPNPLTSVSNFVFTLTGAQMPDLLEIQIFDVTGKNVKTINLTGKVKSGINTFSWDGTNDNGGLLNQGMYLYKVVSRINGKDYDHFPLPEDASLNQGYGKIMILRDE